MPIKYSVALLLASLFLTACSDDEQHTNSDSAIGPAIEADLSGKAFVDDIGDGQFVIISFYPDKTYSEIANDNGSRTTDQASGVWDLTGDEISINLTNESFVFRDVIIDGGQLSFLLPFKSERVYLPAITPPTLTELTKEFYFEDCDTCSIKFDIDNRGVSKGDGDGEFSFSWHYLLDGSVDVVFDNGLGSERFFFTGKDNSHLSFIGLNDFSDEPEAYLENGRLLFELGKLDSDDDIITALEITNLNENNFPWNGSAYGKLKRWDYETTLIPVKINGSALAEAALNQIELILGKVIFDRTSIRDIEDEDITHGLIVSEGSALGPGGRIDRNTCGHVSGGMASTSYPYNFYDDSGVISTRLYVHLSSSMCDADQGVAIHEFGHAMGMGNHFEGFGIGPASNNNFWNVLYNLYSNGIGLTVDELNIITFH